MPCAAEPPFCPFPERWLAENFGIIWIAIRRPSLNKFRLEGAGTRLTALGSADGIMAPLTGHVWLPLKQVIEPYDAILRTAHL